MTNQNLILLADAYKYSHHKLYMPKTTRVYSYLESRGGKFDHTVFYGLQYFLKQYLEGEVITQAHVKEANKILPKVFGRDDVYDASKFEYIIQKHQGRLPIRIKAIPEGTTVPTSNVLMTIENTDPDCYWLTNFLETLLMQVWYPCTVATLSREIKRVITRNYEDTATPESFAGIEFVLNDFGFRGVSSVESAGLGGSAHLVNFRGSDTIAGSMMALNYYDTEEVYGLSVPATEHSICTLQGESGEKQVFQHVIEEFPSGILACVSDSYDIFRAVKDYWGTALKAQVLQREGTLVIRPDSGDPVLTLLRVFELLFEQFGFTVNEKGYKVLPPQVRVIQGDGIDYESIIDIYAALKSAQISAENLVLGMGGALLQKLNRDTQKFALKCSYAEIDGKGVMVQKSPKELDENGNLIESFKKSKGGQLKLIKDDHGYRTVNADEPGTDHLETVFENGALIRSYSFEEVRKNAGIC
ncbi:MAG: nicotinate phosphoribosyltransferase [Cytophagales bacterium]|nr:nicotinate phosphoribosyltransferase [Cytophagales bacterium]